MQQNHPAITLMDLVSMMAHHALYILEIITVVFDKLDGNKLALVNSAQSCWMFSSLALNLLWKGLDSIHPLCKLLPIDFEQGNLTDVRLISINPLC
jgi:hypothetical protein